MTRPDLIMLLVIGAIGLLIPLSSAGQSIPAPISSRITRDLQSKQPDIVLVDVRSSSEFKKEHIAGAINVPLTKLKDHAFAGKNALIVYCGDKHCPLSAKAAVLLASEGHANVRVLEGGLAAWKELGYAVEPPLAAERVDRILPGELSKELAHRQWRVLDVRPAEEFIAAHVPGAINIPLEDLSGKVSSLEKQKWIVYDRMTGRSHQAAAILAEQGFLVKELVGGIAVWIAKGYSLETGAKQGSK